MSFVLEYDPERPERGAYTTIPTDVEPVELSRPSVGAGFVLEYDPERPERGKYDAAPTGDTPIEIVGNIQTPTEFQPRDLEAFQRGQEAMARKYEGSFTPAIDAWAEGLLFGGTAGDGMGGNITAASRLPLNVLESYRTGQGLDIGRDFERGRSQRMGELDYIQREFPKATTFGATVGAAPLGLLALAGGGRALGGLPSIPGTQIGGPVIQSLLRSRLGQGGLFGGGFEVARRAVGDGAEWLFGDLIK